MSLERDKLVVEARIKARRIVSGETEGVNCRVTGGNITMIELLNALALGREELELLLEAESRERAREASGGLEASERRERAREKRRSSKAPAAP